MVGSAAAPPWCSAETMTRANFDDRQWRDERQFGDTRAMLPYFDGLAANEVYVLRCRCRRARCRHYRAHLRRWQLARRLAQLPSGMLQLHVSSNGRQRPHRELRRLSHWAGFGDGMLLKTCAVVAQDARGAPW